VPLPDLPTTSPDTPSAHRIIAEALGAGDRLAAGEATRRHIRFVRDALMARVES